MGTIISTEYTHEDGQYMAFNSYPLCKSKNRPMSEAERRIRDPDGSREKMLIEVRYASIIAQEKYNKKYNK